SCQQVTAELALQRQIPAQNARRMPIGSEGDPDNGQLEGGILSRNTWCKLRRERVDLSHPRILHRYAEQKVLRAERCRVGHCNPGFYEGRLVKDSPAPANSGLAVASWIIGEPDPGCEQSPLGLAATVRAAGVARKEITCRRVR